MTFFVETINRNYGTSLFFFFNAFLSRKMYTYLRVPMKSSDNVLTPHAALKVPDATNQIKTIRRHRPHKCAFLFTSCMSQNDVLRLHAFVEREMPPHPTTRVTSFLFRLFRIYVSSGPLQLGVDFSRPFPSAVGNDAIRG